MIWSQLEAKNAIVSERFGNTMFSSSYGAISAYQKKLKK